MSGLFPLWLKRDVRLYSRDDQLLRSLGHDVAGRKLRAGTRVEVLDIFTSGFYVMTKHGKAILGPGSLRPHKNRASNP